MSKAEEKRKEQTKKIRMILIAVIVVCVVVMITIIAALLKKDSSEILTENEFTESPLEKASREESKLLYGGDYETYYTLNSVVYNFWDSVMDGDYDILWSLWDENLLEYYGYKYTEEELVNYYKGISNKYHLDTTDPNYVGIEYEGITYQDYNQYYLFTFELIFRYYENGQLKATEPTQYTYTLEKFDAPGGANIYQLLDFNIRDVGMQSYRFKSTSENTNNKGIQVSPGMYIPAETSSSTESSTKASTTAATATKGKS